MNVRKNIDYSELFAALDRAVRANLSEMEMYKEIGKLISSRHEKGTAVAAAEYLQAEYPDITGFSSRNVRRMRDFYRAYENDAASLSAAMTIGWSQNAVILDAELAAEKRAWYISAVRQFGWSKRVLADRIAERACDTMMLDMEASPCYTEADERLVDTDDKDSLCVPREYLQKSNGGVRDEGYGGESRTSQRNTCFLCGNHYGGDWESCLRPGEKEAHRAWHRMRRKDCAADALSRLRTIRPAHRHGSGEPARYAPNLPRRSRGQDPLADGLYRPPRGCCRPMVYAGFRNNVARCRGRVPRAA